jgi:hypothetical protein
MLYAANIFVANCNSSRVIKDHQGSSRILKDPQGSSRILKDHQEYLGSSQIIKEHQGFLLLELTLVAVAPAPS